MLKVQRSVQVDHWEEGEVWARLSAQHPINEGLTIGLFLSGLETRLPARFARQRPVHP